MGSGPMEAALRHQVAKNGLASRTTFFTAAEEPLTREQISTLYLGSAVVAVPSVWGDPAPLVRLEAMAHGRPVVGFDSGGVASCIVDGATGFVVPRMDVDGLRDRIQMVISDTALAERLGRAALSRAQSDHHPELISARHETIYSKVISDRQGRERLSSTDQMRR